VREPGLDPARYPDDGVPDFGRRPEDPGSSAVPGAIDGGQENGPNPDSGGVARSPMAGPGAPSGRPRRLLGYLGAMFGLLAIQNLAGIWLNLYVAVVDTSSYGGVYPAMFASVAGALHTVVGALVGVMAVLTIALAWRLPDHRLRNLALLVLGLVAGAAYLGFHFVVSGGDNAYSFAMEACFMGIVITEAAMLYLATQTGSDAAPAAPGTAA
jgi:hypothetical protein